MSPILGIWASSKFTQADTGAMFPLQVVTVGAAGASSVSFTNIPTTGYSHLQIRGTLRFASTGDINLRMGNGSVDTGANYAYHSLYGTGSSALALSATSTSNGAYLGYYVTNNDIFAGFVTDILDYANTNKYKTVRTLQGYDSNGGGIIMFSSSLWQSTSAVNTLTIYSKDSVNLAQYSQFALYGVKSA
jgi:hypothetical protein